MTVPQFNDRMGRVYWAVVEAGPHGMAPHQLVKHLYEPGEVPAPSAEGQLRVTIHGINQIISERDQRIESKPRGHYRLISLRGEEDGKTVKEANTGRNRQHRHQHQNQK